MSLAMMKNMAQAAKGKAADRQAAEDGFSNSDLLTGSAKVAADAAAEANVKKSEPSAIFVGSICTYVTVSLSSLFALN